MRIPEETCEAVDQARARGALYALLSWGWAYPDEDSISGLRHLADQIASSPGAKNLLPDINEKFEAFQRSLNTATAANGQLESQYAGLFGHAVRGACPLYELEYGRAEIVQQAGELADIAGFYQAFELEQVSGRGERVDHISVECEFASIMCAKYALGVLTDSTALRDVSFDALRAFLRDHLARWAPALFARVIKESTTSDEAGEPVYASLARLGASFIASECEAMGVKSGPEYLELRPVDPQADTEIQCGTGGTQVVPLTVAGLRP